MASRDFDSYHSQRDDTQTFFSYGLQRRFAEICSEFRNWLDRQQPPPHPVRVVDFGCGDAKMLNWLNREFPTVISRAIGLDSFSDSTPPVDDPAIISLASCDLRKTPYDFPDNSFDFAIVSAFLKHNPVPVPFLREVDRLLTDHGRVVLLDPTPTVVRIGAMLGYFDKRYTPFPWSPASLGRLLKRETINLRLLKSHRYWIAPNRRMYELGTEKLFPGFAQSDWPAPVCRAGQIQPVAFAAGRRCPCRLTRYAP